MERLREKPFAVIGINSNNPDPAKLKAIMEKEKLTWRSFADGGAIAGQWPAAGTPAFYVIDARGVIRAKWVGNPGGKAIDRTVEKLIEEAQGPGKPP